MSSFDPELNPGEVISNDELIEKFGVGRSGGMRRSRRNNCLVIVSDHTRGIYEDRWEGNVLHYTGMGLVGHQSLDYMQNKTLNESNRNGVIVYLFEVFEAKRYFFHGEVKLVADAYQEEQLDDEGRMRKVWIFPVQPTDEFKFPIVYLSTIATKQSKKEKQTSKLSKEELEKRAKATSGKTSKRLVSTNVYERNPYVSELAKRRAKGICQLCEHTAPFKDPTGNPFLETHHIAWLSEGGLDTLENTVALCPNCHRKMHSLNPIEDRLKLIEIAAKMSV